MSPIRPHAAGLSKGVEFIDKDDAGGLLLGLYKKVTHPCRSQSHEHLHKFRSGEAEERHAAFTGDGLGQKRFSCPRRAHQEDALGYPASQFAKFPWVFQKFDNFNQLLLGFVNTGNVFEGNVQFIFHIYLCLVFADSHETGLLGAHLLHEEVPDADKEYYGENPRKDVTQKSRFDFPFENDFVLFKQGGQFRVNPDCLEGLRLAGSAPIHFHFTLNLISRYRHVNDLSSLEKVQKLAVRYHLGGKHGCDIALDNQDRPYA